MRKWIELDGHRYRWKDILRLRREQEKQDRQQRQPQLFELQTDSRPISQKTADGRYCEPTLFEKGR